MRAQYNFATSIVAVSLQLGLPGTTAWAGLFSSISYDQTIVASPFNQLGTGEELKGTTLPVSQTLSLTDGASAQATYNFTDNGTVAALSIVGSFSLQGQGQAAGEGTEGLDTGFEFSQPVSYQILFQGTSSPNLSGGGLFTLYTDYGGTVFSSSNLKNSSWEETGTFPAGVGYYFDEQYNIFTGPPGPVYLGSGTDSLSLTFTAIPEPSSFCLLAAVGTGLLSRRRQP